MSPRQINKNDVDKGKEHGKVVAAVARCLRGSAGQLLRHSVLCPS